MLIVYLAYKKDQFWIQSNSIQSIGIQTLGMGTFCFNTSGFETTRSRTFEFRTFELRTSQFIRFKACRTESNVLPCKWIEWGYRAKTSCLSVTLQLPQCSHPHCIYIDRQRMNSRPHSGSGLFAVNSPPRCRASGSKSRKLFVAFWGPRSFVFKSWEVSFRWRFHSGQTCRFKQ